MALVVGGAWGPEAQAARRANAKAAMLAKANDSAQHSRQGTNCNRGVAGSSSSGLGGKSGVTGGGGGGDCCGTGVDGYTTHLVTNRDIAAAAVVATSSGSRDPRVGRRQPRNVSGGDSGGNVGGHTLDEDKDVVPLTSTPPTVPGPVVLVDESCGTVRIPSALTGPPPDTTSTPVMASKVATLLLNADVVDSDNGDEDTNEEEEMNVAPARDPFGCPPGPAAGAAKGATSTCVAVEGMKAELPARVFAGPASDVTPSCSLPIDDGDTCPSSRSALAGGDTCLSSGSALASPSVIDVNGGDDSGTSLVRDLLDLEDVEDIDCEQLPALMLAMAGHILELALDGRGCRVVQRALELSNYPVQLTIVDELRGHVREAIESPHANHVLQRCIELMRPSSVAFVLTELAQCGRPAMVARHRYGCRVLERLIEHFPPESIGSVLDEILEDSVELCRHVYGNFVMQHILEHGEVAHRQGVVNALREDLPGVALDQHACSVLDKALSYGDLEDQRQLAAAVIREKGLVAAMGSLRGGFAATQRLFRVAMTNRPLLDEARRQVIDRSHEMQRTKHGRALITALAPECLLPVASPTSTPHHRGGTRGHAPPFRGGGDRRKVASNAMGNHSGRNSGGGRRGDGGGNGGGRRGDGRVGGGAFGGGTPFRRKQYANA